MSVGAYLQGSALAVQSIGAHFGALLDFEFLVFWMPWWVGGTGLAPLPTIPSTRLGTRRVFLMRIDLHTASCTAYMSTVCRTRKDFLRHRSTAG